VVDVDFVVLHPDGKVEFVGSEFEVQVVTVFVEDFQDYFHVEFVGLLESELGVDEHDFVFVLDTHVVELLLHFACFVHENHGRDHPDEDFAGPAAVHVQSVVEPLTRAVLALVADFEGKVLVFPDFLQG